MATYGYLLFFWRHNFNNINLDEKGETVKVKKIVATVLRVIGCAMIILSVLFIILSTIQQNNAVKNVQEITSAIHNILPDITISVPRQTSNPQMPVMEIDHQNFIGLIEASGYSKELPIHSSWSPNKISSYPCRFSGSVYSNNLIIGGSSDTGQFDFMKNISLNDSIYVTDFYGYKYGYLVTDIQTTTDVSAETLNSFDADLLLFAPDKYTFDYLIVCCKLL